MMRYKGKGKHYIGIFPFPVFMLPFVIPVIEKIALEPDPGDHDPEPDHDEAGSSG